ncbi:MAG: protein kinase [Longimicrobiales bacterium]|nr:protein kinase [Longimicrobiales bacterium]
MTDEFRDRLQASLGSACTLERELGGGGMSRVFVAIESALGRQVVVKVLPPDTGSSVSAERFKREIQVAAKLQHPHIVPVLTAGESQGLPYYTMPFVKGESLRARLAKSGELSVNEAVHVLRDIASALAYAHGEGVVHRDIKPENVMLSGGVAVVTDFGVAKAVDMALGGGGSAKSGLTSLGVALGTPAYMAPEQAAADPHVDHRADIYSFGCVAYEMLAGSSPFAGRSQQQLLVAHVIEVPESLLKRRAAVPPGLAALVMKCLEKRAGDRPQSANELIATLDAIATPSDGITPTMAQLAPARVDRNRWFVAAGTTLVLLAIVIVIRVRGSAPATLQPGAQTPVAVTADIEFEPAISPDGKLVAYSVATPAGQRIFVRQIDGGRANLLTGDLDGDHGCPRWSPDGSRISFGAKDGIYVVPALGGTPKRTVEAGLFDHTLGNFGVTHAWSPDGKQLAYGNELGIWVQPLAGGQARNVVEGALLHSPAWSPDGRLLAYVEGTRPSFINLSTSGIWVIPVDGGTQVRLSDSTHVNLSPVWAVDGRSVLYISNAEGTRDVYQQAVGSNGRPVGKPARMTTGLGPYTITLSADGSRLAYDVVHGYSNIAVAPIPSGSPVSFAAATRVTRDNQRVEKVRLSHDGKWLAYDSDRGGNFDIYKLRLDGGEPVQLTTDPGNDFGPAWSPDDRQIAFHSSRTGTRRIYVVSAEGSGDVVVASGPTSGAHPDWSPDGQRIAFYTVTAHERTMFVTVRDADGQWGAPQRLTSETLYETNPQWSPDGRLVAYTRVDDVAVIAPEGGPPRVIADERQLGGVALSVAWGGDGATVYASVRQSTGLFSFWAIPVGGGTPRLLLAEDAVHRMGNFQFATDGERLFFTLAAWEADAWVMDFKR